MLSDLTRHIYLEMVPLEAALSLVLPLSMDMALFPEFILTAQPQLLLPLPSGESCPTYHLPPASTGQSQPGTVSLNTITVTQQRRSIINQKHSILSPRAGIA